MRNANRKLAATLKGAVLCGLSRGHLRFVKSLCTTIGSKGACVNSLTHDAPYLLRDASCACAIAHRHVGLQSSGSPIAQENYGSDGHEFAFAAFFIGEL